MDQPKVTSPLRPQRAASLPPEPLSAFGELRGDLPDVTVRLGEARRAQAPTPGRLEPATVAGADAGSRFRLTIELDDVDTVCSELAAKGIELLTGR